MKQEYMRRRVVAVGLALWLGLVLILSLMAGLALAQGPRRRPESMLPRVDAPPPEVEIRWLILDPVRSTDEILPSLLEALTVLEARGLILDFDETPQASAPTAAPGLRVAALSSAWARLRHLPGVLDVSDALPSPPLEITSGVGTFFLSTATITGRVTDADTGAGLAAAHVFVYDAVSYAHIGGTLTDADGYYTTTVTAPFDRAKVRFLTSTYAIEWYDDNDYFSAADAVDLSAGGTVRDVNAALEKAGTIQGAVTFEGSGDPATVIEVDAFGTDGSYGGFAWPDASGRYTITLRAGGYNLWFDGTTIATEWYQDRNSQVEADAVNVNADQTTTVDAQVSAAGWITGVVTDETTGLPVPVLVLALAYDQSGVRRGDVGVVDPSGAYRIGGLGTGDYKVLFWDLDGFYDYEYYDDKPDLDQADPVAVTAGMTTTDVNAAMMPITPLGTVTGTIEELAWPLVRSPLDVGDHVYIYFYDTVSDTLVDSRAFWGDGSTTTYTVHLPAGTYKALFVEDADVPQYAPKWYDNQTSYASADLVTVTAGETTTDVSALLSLPWVGSRGCIEGTVLAAASGAELPHVQVQAYAARAENYHYDDTDSNGEYQICGLLGDYQVRFIKAPYIPEWYDGALARTDAPTVTVTAGGTTNVNAALDLGGCVSGQVTDLSGLLLGGWSGFLRLYDSAGERVEFHSPDWLDDFAIPEDDGSFFLCGLPSGDYVVECSSEFRPLDGHAPVTVNAGDETSGVTCMVASRIYLPLILRNHD